MENKKEQVSINVTTGKHLVLGLGQIGTAIRNVLECHGFDPNGIIIGAYRFAGLKENKYEMIHICFPYSKDFTRTVKRYQKMFNPKVTVIHSTVPVGLSDKLGACHSPVRGIHPHLEQGVRTFTKFIGGKGSILAGGAFSRAGISCHLVKNAKTTELLKLWDTTQYGLNIMIEKEIYLHCIKHGADFNTVYTLANESYNDGYRKLGRPEYQKYVLKHVTGPIGGHCVIPNLPLLNHKLGKILAGYNYSLTAHPKGAKMKS